METAARWAWNAITVAALAASPAAWAAWSLARRERPERLGERWGLVPRVPGRPAWLHAASLGEVRAVEPLLRIVAEAEPGVPLALSSTTSSGRRAAAGLASLLAAPAFAPPLDAPPCVAAALDRLVPRALVSVETEIWPTTWRACARRGVPVALVNGRISDRALPRYRLATSLLRPTLEAGTLFAMRSAEDASRLVELGADPGRVVVTGDLKFDAALAHADAPSLPWAAEAGLEEGPWVVFASTAAGEEDLVLDAHEEARRRVPGLRALLAPRRADQWDEVARKAAARGLPTVRRTALAGAVPAGGVLVLDSVGELARLYRHAEVVFVGGSLVARGGQNLLEPAAAGRAVLFGPHVENFRDAEAALLAAGGGERVTAATLGPTLVRLLGDDAARQAAGAAARAAVERHEGAARRTHELLAPLLRHAGPR